MEFSPAISGSSAAVFRVEERQAGNSAHEKANTPRLYLGRIVA
jgi:hypothetical protein